MHFKAFFLLALAASSLFPAQFRPSDIAEAVSRMPGVPRYSDVCLSSRWYRKDGLRDRDPKAHVDGLDTFQMARDLFATRFEWAYIMNQGDTEFIRKANEGGIPICVSVNTLLADEVGGSTFLRGRTRDLTNGFTTRPDTWQWNVLWGCSIHPDYREVWLKHARFLVGNGATALQQDDPSFNVQALHFGGCFCDACDAGFSAFLKRTATPAQLTAAGINDPSTFSYRAMLLALGNKPREPFYKYKSNPWLKERFVAFQTWGVQDFFRYVHGELDRTAGKKITYSCNSEEPYLQEVHDFAVAEYYSPMPLTLYETFAIARKRGKPVVLTLAKPGVFDNRLFVASSYATGGSVIAPWDVYVGSYVPRFYGKKEDFAPLYAMARQMAPFLDGYEDAGAVGPEAFDARYPSSPITVENPSNLYAFIRAVPKNPEAPVVVHLLRTAPDPATGITLSFNPAAFFGGSVKLRMITPIAYDAGPFSKASETKRFDALVETRVFADPSRTQFRLPPFDLWAMLVVEKDPNPLVQPYLSGERVFQGSQTVTLVAAPGNEIRYTLDDREPGPKSPLYSAPLVIKKSLTIKARSFGPAGASAVASAAFTAKSAFDFAADPALLLWLKADALAEADGAPVPEWKAAKGPSLTVPPTAFPDGATPVAPTLSAGGMGGKAAVSFSGNHDVLSAPGLLNEFGVSRAFTVFMVTRSDDPLFGFCGNMDNGNGGVPRFYATRGSLIYDQIPQSVNPSSSAGYVETTCYAMDPEGQVRAFKNGAASGSLSVKPVASFGGGAFAMPFMSGNVCRKGMVSEVLVWNRCLSEDERASVTRYLMKKYPGK
ncbi:MAG: chitobiase/beta-hexosaminidase C-terminal domain-containing protein [Spirochaetes bacterium]|nr:chitobiase/beta-hexosaminidase C-terminal domain-containing protein [Spirochaetota bacterium]